VDKAHKLIRKWDATDAAVHDSQKLDDVLDLSNTGKEVWADSAYCSVEIEAGLKEKGLQSRIHRRAARNRPLSERQKSANTTRLRAALSSSGAFHPASLIKNWLLLDLRDGAQIVQPTLRGATPELDFRQKLIALSGGTHTDDVDLRYFANGARINRRSAFGAK
jgi:hypothetical protein